MNEDSVELNGLDIKPHIISQRNCRISGSGYVMEAVNSNLIVDLNSFPGIIKATIVFSRISGNGKVKINNTNTDVLSKNFHQIDLDIIENKKIEFTRDKDSVGKILINKIIIINVENLFAKLAENELKATESAHKLKKYNENWKSSFIKLGNVRGIKLINNRIYAQEGAKILHSNIIEYIETEPPKSFVISDVIKFIYPCEITAVYFKQEFESNVENKYQHFTKPPTIQSNLMYSLNNKSLQLENNMTLPQNIIIYDSVVSKLEPSSFINPKEIAVNQGKENSLLLKREAEFGIPLSELKSNTQYTISVILKKINGNGKFGIAIGTTNGEIRSSSVIIAPDRESEIYIKLDSENPPALGSTYMLKIFRPEDSTVGDVLLERLRVNSSVNIFGPAVVKKTLYKNLDNSKVYNINYVLNNSKKFSKKLNWESKIKQIYNIGVSNTLFQNLNSLTKSDIIWVEPFGEDSISEESDLILSKAKMLISSCPENVDLFKNKYPNTEIHFLEKVWPKVTPKLVKFPTGNYTVLIHRDKETTDKIVKSYESISEIPLVIIGATENYPDFVIPINEYVSYDKIIGIIFNSKVLIDMPKVSNYLSGILSLSIDNGLSVLTSNKYYSNKDNVTYISDIEEFNVKIYEALKNTKINKDEDNSTKLQNVLSILSKEV